MECETCGGTDFYNEDGYFYCNECQTQSQQVRDHVQEDYFNLKSSKKIKKPEQEKLNRQLTSWECYNVIMHELTQQLIKLGATKNFKSIVKCLWMKYLEKLDVICLTRDVLPSLSLVNCRRDAQILYGHGKRKRKRRKSSGESSVTSQSMSSLKREQTKKKTALAQVQYEEFSHKSLDTSSLQNETLTSLKTSDSEKSTNDTTPVNFNRYSKKELKKRIPSQNHYKDLRYEKEQNLGCHSLTYRNCSKEYKLGVHFISPIKLYCILYLGLLINKDKIQLGDIFRFIREGHLSFNNYTQLFPEDYSNKFLNVQNNSKNHMFTNKCFRTTAAKLAKYLDVVRYIQVPDLTELCYRFCTELNLPEEISYAVNNLISKTIPKLDFTKQKNIIPNYEARAMSVILFTLKLLFGLDGVTEFELSKYAHLVNNLKISETGMFDVIRWMEYLVCRNLLMSDHHLPSFYQTNSDEIDSDLFLQYIHSKDIRVSNNIKLTKEMQDYKELLLKLKDLQNDHSSYAESPPSFTPFLEYSKIFVNYAKNEKVKALLNESFHKKNLEFLLKPNNYMDLVGENVEIKHGGANDNWTIEGIGTYNSIKDVNRQNHNLISVKVIKNGSEKHINTRPTSLNKKRDPRFVQAEYQEYRQSIFRKNEQHIRSISKLAQVNKDDLNLELRSSSKLYNIQFNPYERYWLYLQMSVDQISKRECQQFFDKYTTGFKLIFKECARIIEQSDQEFLYEFQYSELFLVYVATYCRRNNKSKPKVLLNPNLKYYVKQAQAHW